MIHNGLLKMHANPWRWVWEEVGKTEHRTDKNPSFTVLFLVDVLSPEQRLRFEVYNVLSSSNNADGQTRVLTNTIRHKQKDGFGLDTNHQSDFPVRFFVLSFVFVHSKIRFVKKNTVLVWIQAISLILLSAFFCCLLFSSTQKYDSSKKKDGFGLDTSHQFDFPVRFFCVVFCFPPLKNTIRKKKNGFGLDTNHLFDSRFRPTVASKGLDPANHCLVGTVEVSVSELNDRSWELTRDIDVSLPEKSVVKPGTMTIQAHAHHNPKRIGVG